MRAHATLTEELRLLSKERCTVGRLKEIESLMSTSPVDDSRATLETVNRPSGPTPIYNAKGEIRQCNEGKYEYRLNEDNGKMVFEIRVPKYMESVVEIDVERDYIRFVIRGKVTQVRIDEPVCALDCKTTYNKSTGWYKLEIPIEGKVPRTVTVVGDRNDVPPPLESINVYT
jgi:hypothetical protein